MTSARLLISAACDGPAIRVNDTAADSATEATRFAIDVGLGVTAWTAATRTDAREVEQVATRISDTNFRSDQDQV